MGRNKKNHRGHFRFRFGEQCRQRGPRRMACQSPSCQQLLWKYVKISFSDPHTQVTGQRSKAAKIYLCIHVHAYMYMCSFAYRYLLGSCMLCTCLHGCYRLEAWRASTTSSYLNWTHIICALGGNYAGLIALREIYAGEEQESKQERCGDVRCIV